MVEAREKSVRESRIAEVYDGSGFGYAFSVAQRLCNEVVKQSHVLCIWCGSDVGCTESNIKIRRIRDGYANAGTANDNRSC